MKKNNDFEEFLNLLEEAVNKIVDENASEKRPVNITININLYPVMAVNPEAIFVQQEKCLWISLKQRIKSMQLCRFPE